MRAAGDARFKTVHLGKDQRPVSIMKLASMTDHSWQRGASFNHLAKVMKGQVKNYNLADLVTVVANELPISTESAVEEAESAGEKLRQEFFDIRNLDGCYFMTSKGSKKSVKSEKLQDRPHDLTYFAFLCIVDPKLADSRMTHANLATSFSLRLPQSIYDKDSDKVIEKIEERSVRKTRDDATGLDKLVGDNALSSVQSDLFGGSTEGTYREPSSPAASGLGQSSAVKSPKMSRIIGESAYEEGDSHFNGYYGPFTFLDNQASFDAVFGKDPSILPFAPLQKNGEGSDIPIKEKIDTFVDSCKFDVFLDACRNYYVGLGSDESDIQATHAACKAINKLQQEYKVAGRYMKDNPDVFFGKFMDVVPMLPDDSSKWSTQLCTAYFNALTPELKSRMENDGFIMPALNQLNSKKDQIDALQKVREKATSAFKKLKDETDLIKQIMAATGNNGSAAGRGRVFVTNEATNAAAPVPAPAPAPAPNENGGTVLVYGQQASPAEETMQRYSTRAPNPQNLPVKEGRDGQMYPFREDDPATISKYPIGFRGCFRCGNPKYHERGMEPCPRLNDPAARMIFLRELWIHKPHTKRFNAGPANFGTAQNEFRNVRIQFFITLKLISLAAPRKARRTLNIRIVCWTTFEIEHQLSRLSKGWARTEYSNSAFDETSITRLA